MSEINYPTIPDETIDNRFSSTYVDLLSGRLGGLALSCSDESVSYTHLTLPTICSV